MARGIVNSRGNLLAEYIEHEYGKTTSAVRDLLLQAYEMRALIIVLDGVDEGGGLRQEIERVVHDTLVPSGNRLVVTSRPEGVRPELYLERFVVMSLQALDDAQQRAVIQTQLQGSVFL